MKVTQNSQNNPKDDQIQRTHNTIFKIYHYSATIKMV